MSEQKFDPVKEFVNLRDSLTKAVGEGIKNAAGYAADFPAVDVYQTEDEIVIRTEPILGLDTSSLEISMEEGILVIRGETRNDLDMPTEAYLIRELQFGTFARSVRIPGTVKSQEASASLKKNGSLTVKLPRSDKKAGQIINVTPAE